MTLSTFPTPSLSRQPIRHLQSAGPQARSSVLPLRLPPFSFLLPMLISPTEMLVLLPLKLPGISSSSSSSSSPSSSRVGSIMEVSPRTSDSTAISCSASMRSSGAESMEMSASV
jgi:hypothetical protein